MHSFSVYRYRLPALALALGSLAGLISYGKLLAPTLTDRVSVAADGAQASGASANPSISANGRFVAFDSVASNLVQNDTNGVSDVFVKDLMTGAVIRVSVDSNGFEGNGASGYPSISADGMTVAFESSATNLVPADTNAVTDVFVRQISLGVTTRVSVSSGGVEANSSAFNAAISGDGRVIAFTTSANNLVSGDAGVWHDVFAHSLDTGTTTLVSVATDGARGNFSSGYLGRAAISEDGSIIAFQSVASTLVAGDTNGSRDVFLRDTANQTTTRVSVGPGGVEGNADSGSTASRPGISMSSDGRFVAFSAIATNLVSNDSNGHRDIFVRDRQLSVTTLVSVASNGDQALGDSYANTMSADGSVVVFDSSAANLVAGDTNGFVDIFRHDLTSGSTTRLSVSSLGSQGSSTSFIPTISALGESVAFYSFASNLVTGDTNQRSDVFVRGRLRPSIVPRRP